MTYTISRLAPENMTSAEATKSLTDTRPASYKLEYFDTSSVAGVARDVLSYGNAEWENLPIKNWPAEIEAPFGVFPVLHVRTGDGQELKLAETIVIEQYLAKEFGLLGDNAWEELQIKMFHSSSLYLRERLFMRVTWNYKDVMEKALNTFLTQTLPLWIKTHSKHLKDNGSNGYYVGNKLSLADIQTANCIDHFKCLYGADKIMALIEESPEIMKVKESVDNEPRLQKWRQSDTYKAHSALSQKLYANTGI